MIKKVGANFQKSQQATLFVIVTWIIISDGRDTHVQLGNKLSWLCLHFLTIKPFFFIYSFKFSLCPCLLQHNNLLRKVVLNWLHHCTDFKVKIAWSLLLLAQLMSMCKIPDKRCYNNNISTLIHWRIIISKKEINIVL